MDSMDDGSMRTVVKHNNREESYRRSVEQYLTGVDSINDWSTDDMVEAAFMGGLTGRDPSIPLRLFVDTGFHVPMMERRFRTSPSDFMVFVRSLSHAASIVYSRGRFDLDSDLLSSYSLDEVETGKPTFSELDEKLMVRSLESRDLDETDAESVRQARRAISWTMDLLGFRRVDDENQSWTGNDGSGYAGALDAYVDLPVFIEPGRPLVESDQLFSDGLDGMSAFVLDDWDFSVLVRRISSRTVTDIVQASLDVFSENGHISKSVDDLSMLSYSKYGSPTNRRCFDYRKLARIGEFAYGCKRGEPYVRLYNDLISWWKSGQPDFDWSLVSLEWLWDSTDCGTSIQMFVEDVRDGILGVESQ